MEIKSKVSESQQIDTQSIITFPLGIPGFEDQTQFQLFQLKDSEVVYSLQSITNEDLAFSVALSSHFNINYNFVLSNEEDTALGLESIDDLLILLILHKDDLDSLPTQPTIKGSIKSPLLINIKKRIGIQKTLALVEQSITLTEQKSEIEVSEV